MAFERLEYGRDWRDAGDFPTLEDSEAQVRADLQYHPDAVRAFLNGVLLPALEGGGGAALIGAVPGNGVSGGTVQAVLDDYLRRFQADEDDIRTVAGGGVPVASQCTAVEFTAAGWTNAAGGARMGIPEAVHRRSGSGYGFRLWEVYGGQLLSATWHTAATQVSLDSGTGEIVLSAPEAYAGRITFFGI